MDWLYIYVHVYFYVRCLPRRADKSVLLSMHIWCKTEKLVDMYLYLVSESGPTRDRTRSLVTRREWTSDGLQIWSVSHSQYTEGPSGMKNIFLDDRD